MDLTTLKAIIADILDPTGDDPEALQHAQAVICRHWRTLPHDLDDDRAKDFHEVIRFAHDLEIVRKEARVERHRSIAEFYRTFGSPEAINGL